MAETNYYNLLSEPSQNDAPDRKTMGASGAGGARKENETCTSDGSVRIDEVQRRKRKKNKKSGSDSGSDSRYEDFRIDLLTSQYMETIEKLQNENRQLAFELAELRSQIQSKVPEAQTIRNSSSGVTSGNGNPACRGNNDDNNMDVVVEVPLGKNFELSAKVAEDFGTAKRYTKDTTVQKREIWVKATPNTATPIDTSKGAIKKTTAPVHISELKQANGKSATSLTRNGESTETHTTSRITRGNERVLRESQFGFRASTSTTHALMALTNRVVYGFIDRSVTIAASLDFEKAFDTVWQRSYWKLSANKSESSGQDDVTTLSMDVASVTTSPVAPPGSKMPLPGEVEKVEATPAPLALTNCRGNPEKDDSAQVGSISAAALALYVAKTKKPKKGKRKVSVSIVRGETKSTVQPATTAAAAVNSATAATQVCEVWFGSYFR
uniref:Uncharacterized protein n=1 Tax=Stomoxys calcitrans TaxID=35570 RepID=A0A1I8P4U0_STOCA